MTHPYQTLLREITTPTLPSFVTSLINLISSKSPTAKPSPLLEVALQCMAMLLPRHTTVFRPFASQIQLVIRPLLAPTLSDNRFVSSSVKLCARRLAVLLHQTAPKSTGGEEWGKAMREVVKQVHVTADQVFRAVVEDCESNAGYTVGSVDVNQQVSGGDAHNLSRWSGMTAGVERLVGLLELLQEYFKADTPFAVSIPLGSIFDMITRILSLQMPSPSSAAKSDKGRLHPAIDRDERDGLWCGLPQIYIAALQVVHVLIKRFEEAFMSMAQGSLDLLAWVFAAGRHDPDFRLVIYQIVGRHLTLCGPGLDKAQTSALFPLIRSACHDAEGVGLGGPNTLGTSALDAGNILKGSTASQMPPSPIPLGKGDGLYEAAYNVLPIFMSHMPQEHVDISIRSLLERTAIRTHNKEAMLASILHPFLGRGSKAMPSILPHLTRATPHDAVTEILLRPRMPLIPAASNQTFSYQLKDDSEPFEDVDADMQPELVRAPSPHHAERSEAIVHVKASTAGLGIASNQFKRIGSQPFGTALGQSTTTSTRTTMSASTTEPPVPDIGLSSAAQHAKEDKHEAHDVNMMEDASDSDDESVHLTMELDTDSDDD